MTCLLHSPQFSSQNKATPSFNMLISSKQVACACADDVLSFAAAATTSSTQVYTTEKTISRHLKIIKIIRIILYSGVHNRKTISWHLIPIISFVSSFYSSQRGKLFKAHLSDLRCYRWNVSSTKKLFRVFLNSLIEMNRFFNLSFIHATLH